MKILARRMFRTGVQTLWHAGEHYWVSISLGAVLAEGVAPGVKS